MRDLTRRFDTSLNTVQRAVADLVREGFLETRGRAGTFVSATPPHLARFGLAFLTSPAADVASWSRFHQVIYGESQCARLARGRRFVHYLNLLNREESNPSQIEMVEDIACHRLAGLLLVGAAGMFEHRTRAMDPELPRVCLGHSGDPDVPAVVPDMESWLRRAIDALVRRGRRRIALIELQAHGSDMHDTSTVDRLMRFTAEAGAASEPVFYQPGTTTAPMSVSQAVRLLMSLPRNRRPDGLIVSDDNLVQHAVHGLIESGAQIGDGGTVDVVVHANFPHAVAVSAPLIHLGYDVRWMLARAIELLDEQRGVPLDERPRNREVVCPILSQCDIHAHVNPLRQEKPLME